MNAPYRFKEGTYLGNLIKDGIGLMQYDNGDKFEGEWRNNKINGIGTLFFRNGDIYNGNFKDGQFEGFGILSLRNGSKYEGLFSKNKKNGIFDVLEQGQSSKRRYLNDILV